MNSVLSFDEKLIQHFRTLSLSDSLLAKACEYSLASPGKRLRPRFAQEASRLVGLNSEAAEKIAFAIELIHIFSLVHDDLPCLDNDDFRRGIPTTHKKFNEAQAMLAGDALFSAAMETFVQCGDRIEKINFLNEFLFLTIFLEK